MEHLKKYWYFYAIGILILVIILMRRKSKKKKTQQQSAKAQIYFKNTNSDPYTIYLDGTSVGTLDGGETSHGFDVVPKDLHELRAEQNSGYLFYPTVETDTILVNENFKTTWEF